MAQRRAIDGGATVFGLGVEIMFLRGRSSAAWTAQKLVFPAGENLPVKKPGTGRALDSFGPTPPIAAVRWARMDPDAYGVLAFIDGFNGKLTSVGFTVTPQPPEREDIDRKYEKHKK
ncbi:hypothetical protein ACFQU9_14605 [Actinomadura namibiensis]|uniref:Uncharacterized protein n=1 Tax=Actinomadura namibiensis TaxID=182080 RepID=A0A7W3LZY0_ACTNM|nr:hypothetical protein [Actinomadura namibiensis]MBA8957438.1 hypothetical protein [Actinomadura namibiensis]